MKKLNTKRINRYKYVKVIQQYFATYWEDVSEYETDSKGNLKEYTDKQDMHGCKVSLLRQDLEEYKRMGYPTRVVKRKQLI